MKITKETLARINGKVTVGNNTLILYMAHVPSNVRGDRPTALLVSALRHAVVDSQKIASQQGLPVSYNELSSLCLPQAKFSPGMVEYDHEGNQIVLHYAVVVGPRIPYQITLEEAQHAVNRQADFVIVFP